VQLYRYFVSQSSEFERHNTSCFFSTSVCCCCCCCCCLFVCLVIYSVRKFLDTPSYIHASSGIRTHDPSIRDVQDCKRLKPRGHGTLFFSIFPYVRADITMTGHVARRTDHQIRFLVKLLKCEPTPNKKEFRWSKRKWKSKVSVCNRCLHFRSLGRGSRKDLERNVE
jgi:hypothetical protein